MPGNGFFIFFLAPTQVSVSEICLTQHGLEVMKKVSNKLRHKEKEKLKQKYQWIPDGKMEKLMEADQNMFLAGLYGKEIEQKGAYVDAGKNLLEVYSSLIISFAMHCSILSLSIKALILYSKLKRYSMKTTNIYKMIFSFC